MPASCQVQRTSVPCRCNNGKSRRGRHALEIPPVCRRLIVLQRRILGAERISRWITNRKGERDTGISSGHNGLLMVSNVHQRFDGLDFSIKPDDGYKITCFDKDPFGIDGRILDPICRNPNGDRARNELLRWHFRQAVLANMRGAGEPSFEMDFPPGSDIMGEILSGPEAGKKMEAELFSRVNGLSFV
ncbi:hypothetical protein V1522DRAFT_48699 [Lipomyces starkeyi]